MSCIFHNASTPFNLAFSTFKLDLAIYISASVSCFRKDTDSVSIGAKVDMLTPLAYVSKRSWYDHSAPCMFLLMYMQIDF